MDGRDCLEQIRLLPGFSAMIRQESMRVTFSFSLAGSITSSTRTAKEDMIPEARDFTKSGLAADRADYPSDKKEEGLRFPSGRDTTPTIKTLI
jgi:hypothetical protein